MSNLLQDMMGMLSRKDTVTPKANDYMSLARYPNPQERMKPNPKIQTELVKISDLKTFIGGAGGSVTSVGLTGSAAFSITNSPITTDGDINIAGAGSASQVILGDGTLGSLPVESLGPIGYFSFDSSSTVNSNFTNDLTGITITHTATGQWDVAWTTALSNVNYIVNVSSNNFGGAAQVWAHTKTTQGFKVSSADANGQLVNMLVDMVIYK